MHQVALKVEMISTEIIQVTALNVVMEKLLNCQSETDLGSCPHIQLSVL